MHGIAKDWRLFARPCTRPVLFVHAGLHKTGTTALQACLAQNREALRAQGILYPTAGCPGDAPAQHNIAWQLARDRRFHSAYGTMDDAADEIAAHGGNTIISSEDFESILQQKEWLDKLALHPKLLAYRIVFVIYLREQCSYFQSLFLQITRNGMTQDAARMAEAVYETGMLKLQDWEFQFDYGRMVGRLARWKNGAVVLRNYHRLEGGSTISDFLSIVTPSLHLPEAVEGERINAARNIAEAMLEFYEARIGRELTDWQKGEIAAGAAQVAQTGFQLSWATRQRLAARFEISNRALERIGGKLMKFPALSAGSDTGLTLEQLFSFEMQCRLTGSRLPPGF
ncbi:MAG: hypothetical protein KGK02_00610 [Rhodospirillales bacterium]|nr:hypothetical protein [Rhodospirillales bacterium]